MSRLLAIVMLMIGVAGPIAAQEIQGTRNRDRHGPADVQSYILSLTSTERIAELKPEQVVTELAMPDDAVVADLGSGPGVFTIPLAKHLTRGVVYAVDVEPRQLDALRARLVEEDLHNVVPVLASYSTPHLPLASVDLILVVDTYHHIQQRTDYFRRLRDVLRTGGQLAILEYKAGDLPVGPPADVKLPPGQMHRELEAAGYTLWKSLDTHEHHDFELWVPSTSF